MSLILMAHNHKEHQDGNNEMIGGEVDIVAATPQSIHLCGVAII